MPLILPTLNLAELIFLILSSVGLILAILSTVLSVQTLQRQNSNKINGARHLSVLEQLCYSIESLLGFVFFVSIAVAAARAPEPVNQEMSLTLILLFIFFSLVAFGKCFFKIAGWIVHLRFIDLLKRRAALREKEKALGHILPDPDIDDSVEGATDG